MLTAPPATVPTVFVGPGGDPAVVAAVSAGGGRVASTAAEADAVVWLDRDVDSLRRSLHADVEWVQLPDAGIEPWLAAGIITAQRVFTSARGCYGFQVAEHALALLLAVARRLPECAALASWPGPEKRWGRSLSGATVIIVGAGDIGSTLIDMLVPLRASVVAVTRSGREVPGASRSLGVDELLDALHDADFVVLAAPSTPQTAGLVSTPQLAAMRPDAWLVNVGRGELVDTPALVHALARGAVAGAALDVTDPEPLPADHPFWRDDRVLITPHVANPPAMKTQALAHRVRENTSRLTQGLPLLGVVDAVLGY